MPIRRRNPRNKMVLAGIQGGVIGVVGVLLFGFALNFANDQKEKPEVVETETIEKEEVEKKVEVTTDGVLTLKAQQFGMFTTKESAMAFVSEQPSLEKAGILNVENQFYVWSQLFADEAIAEQTNVLPAFMKTLYVSTDSCESKKVKNMMQLLQEEKLSKKYFDSVKKKEDYPDDMMSIVQAVTAFTDVSSVIRLHIFTHYAEQNECVKLNF
ncbi:hypothetical protein [Psychrobacillus sp.]|uniref:hypothetical protein n=1 Tax=Psychrobacillus sp. TaxID=1871623 RepID=UPI0028BD8F3D|nr:hypothetical protein [Psychrobacillus sp.]